MGKAVVRIDVGTIETFLQEGFCCIRPRRPLYDGEIQAVQLNHTTNTVDFVIESPDLLPNEEKSVPEMNLSFVIGCAEGDEG